MGSRKLLLDGLFGILTFSLAFFIGTSVALLLKSDGVGSNNGNVEPFLGEYSPTFEVPRSQTDFQFDTSQNYYAWYSLERFNGMPEVLLVSVSREVDESGENVSEETNAAVFTSFENDKNEGVYSSVWSEIDSKHVKFRTEKRRGLSYSFEGMFFKDKTIGEQDEKLLRGNLIKFRNGRKVAEVRGDFAYNEPHCWH